MALVATLLIMMLLAATLAVVAITAIAETRVAGHYQFAEAALAGAEAIAARALAELAAIDDWNLALSGAMVSTFTDRTGEGRVLLADGHRLDLATATSQLQCGRPRGCSDDDLATSSADRPWGRDNPRWQLFAYGPIDLPGRAGRVYGAAWVGDDPSENDGDAGHDGTAESNPGSGLILIRAIGFGPGRTRRSLELTVARPPGSAVPGAVRLVAWREVR